MVKPQKLQKNEMFLNAVGAFKLVKARAEKEKICISRYHVQFKCSEIYSNLKLV